MTHEEPSYVKALGGFRLMRIDEYLNMYKRALYYKEKKEFEENLKREDKI